MSSKNIEPKLTLQNLSQQLQKWKSPFLHQVRQTANQFHQKVQHHRKHAIENHLQQPIYQYTSPKKQNIPQTKSPTTQKNITRKLKTQQLTQPQITIPEPKLQEWKSNNEYRFKDLEEIVKNYDEVFKKKHKVKKNKKDQVVEDFRTDQREMIEEIYQELKDKKQLTVSFEAIQQFFKNYELFYYFYNIHPYRLVSLLKQSAKKFEDKLTKNQFIDFFLIDRPTISYFKSATQKNIYNRSILSQQIWKNLKGIFDTLDTFGNEKISIKNFFQRIKNNPSSISILSAEAIQFPDINRVYTLQKILFDLENKMQFDSKVQWQTIQDLIINFTHIQQPTIDIIYSSNIQKAKIVKQSNYFVLQPKIIQIVKEIFNRCPKCCDCFVKTSFFCVQLLEIGIMKPYLNSPTRIQNTTKNTYLSLEQVIKLMQKQAPSYIDMDEMLEFMSIKGYQNQKRFVQLYNNIQTQSSQQQQTAERKNQRRLKKIRSLQQLKKQHKKQKKKPNPQIVTQIKQFNLHKKQQPTIRERKVQEMIKQKQMEDQIQLKKKFKANPIPVSLNPERYERYAKILQKKKESILNRLGMRREQDQNLIEYLKSNTKLFQQRKLRPHCTQPYENYTYQPTPIPLHISEQLLPKIEAQKQQRRKKLLQQNRKKYQQVYWKNIRDTSSFDKDQSLLQKINLIEQKKKFQQIKAKQVPNFDQLHRKFQQELESKKQRFQPTKIQQFKLSSPTNRYKSSQYNSPQSYHFKSKSPPKNDVEVNIKSTKKYDDWVARNQTRMAQKQLEMLKKQKEEEQRYLRQKNFAKLMRKNLSKCTNNTQLLKYKSEQKLRNYKDHVSRLQQQTQQQLAQIYVRVLQRPFLFQDAGATRKPKSKQRPKRIKPSKVSPEQNDSHPYKQGLFEKQGQQFHPIESQNLNQSF